MIKMEEINQSVDVNVDDEVKGVTVNNDEIVHVNHSKETTKAMPAAVKPSEVLQTAPFDPRFPNTNQTRYCYQSYLDFHRCQRIKGESYSPCQYFKKVYSSLCPNAWVEKWDGQREEGIFPGNI